jgi:hypothetical protein
MYTITLGHQLCGVAGDSPDADCRDECSQEGEREDDAEVAEEVFLLSAEPHRLASHLFELVARVEDNGRQQEIKEQSVLECLERQPTQMQRYDLETMCSLSRPSAETVCQSVPTRHAVN